MFDGEGEGEGAVAVAITGERIKQEKYTSLGDHSGRKAIVNFAERSHDGKR